MSLGRQGEIVFHGEPDYVDTKVDDDDDVCKVGDESFLMIRLSKEDEVTSCRVNDVVTVEFDEEPTTTDEENYIAYCSNELFEALAYMLEI